MKVTAGTRIVNERIKQQIWRQWHTSMNALLQKSECGRNEIVSGQQLESKRITRGKYKALSFETASRSKCLTLGGGDETCNTLVWFILHNPGYIKTNKNKIGKYASRMNRSSG